MKIKVKEKSYAELLALPHCKHKKPKRQGFFWRSLLRIVASPDLIATHFRYKKIGMEKLGKHEPALYLMNHSSFIDLEIAARVLYPHPFHIVCTTDGFVGKGWLMRKIGCIPTTKFVADLQLVRDMGHCLHKLKSSVLMFPEAGYSFDGTATALPDSLGKCAKLFGVPVVMIRTFGAFSRDPLYNNLQRRRVRVSAEMEYLLSPEQIREMSAEEIEHVIAKNFSFDAFRWQQEQHVKIDEPFRADHLNRLLYKCPACHAEGQTCGKGVTLSCNACGKAWTLDEYGFLSADKGETEFAHVPDWFSWQRACVREEIEQGTYALNTAVEIYALADTKCLYHVGKGRLTHDKSGFHLADDRGEINYHHKPNASYTLNADFNWYELGDVISFGTKELVYYCFPQDTGDCVTKARLATEEIYKLLHTVQKEDASTAETV